MYKNIIILERIMLFLSVLLQIIS